MSSADIILEEVVVPPTTQQYIANLECVLVALALKYGKGKLVLSVADIEATKGLAYQIQSGADSLEGVCTVTAFNPIPQAKQAVEQLPEPTHPAPLMSQ